MSAIDDWKTFAGALGPDRRGTPAMTGDRSSWSLVFARRGRTLALPTAAIADTDSLDFFLGTTGKRWWARLAMLGRPIAPGLLPQAELSAEQHQALRCMLLGGNDIPEPSTDATTGDIQAIQFGSSGPLQKVIVLGRGDAGRRIIVKMALRASADDRIVAEAAWLRRLAAAPDLAAHLPRVAGTGSTPTGRRYFRMPAVVGKPAAGAFGAPHTELLRRIANADCGVAAWPESLQFRSIETRLQSLVAANAGDLDIVRAGWSAGCRGLAGRRLPLCLSHGDFAAWNLVQTEHCLVALDWEYAQPQANPLADFFHFHLIATALDGRLRQGRVHREPLLANASRYAQAVFAVDGESAAALAAPLLLVYLVDTICFYATASGGIDRNDRVVDSYLQFIAEQT